ncbi:MAG: PadR family transcriptional regulator [Candidatus Omnitrophota bacterium]
MIEHELILLGLLKESPKHGYEIKKKIREILSFFAGLDLKSVYYPLAVMENKGLVVKHADQQGKRPQRFIYALTPKGKLRFKELLTKSFLDFKRPQFCLDSSLYFLNELPAEAVKRRLRGRMQILKKISRSLKLQSRAFKLKGPVPLNKILDHNLQMLEAESKFLAGLIKTI